MKRFLTAAMLILIVFGMSSCKNIKPGYEGVQVNCLGTNKGVVQEVLPIGMKFYVPGFTRIVRYPAYAQTKELKSFNLTAQDGSTITVTPTITLRIAEGTSPIIYTKYRKANIDDLIETVIYNEMQNIYRIVFNELPTEEIIKSRERLENDVADSLRINLKNNNFVLEQLTTDIVFPEGLIKSMEQKNITKQESERAQNELVKAEAEKQKQIIQAQGEAESLKIKGDAEAAYNKKIASSITNTLLEYKKYEKWDGKYPVSIGQGGMMMLKQI